MAEHRVDTERRDHVFVITMTRADKRNAVDRAMADQLDAALNELDDDKDLWVGVLASSGDVFSAGSDLRSRGDYVTDRGGEYGLIRRHRRKPLIAAVEGAALGGGLEIVLACDLVVASSVATFGFPEPRRGLLPTCGGLFRTQRALPLNIAKEMILTGEPIAAPRAAAIGLVNVVTTAGGTMTAALAVADRIVQNSPVSIQASLNALDAAVAAADDEGWRHTDRAKDIVAASHDAAEGIRAFFERRSPDWTGS